MPRFSAEQLPDRTVIECPDCMLGPTLVHHHPELFNWLLDDGHVIEYGGDYGREIHIQPPLSPEDVNRLGLMMAKTAVHGPGHNGVLVSV